MDAKQSPTPTPAPDTNTINTTTGHVFRYGDLVTFPIDHLTRQATVAIVVQVHPVNDECGQDKDKDIDTQLVTLSTGPGKRFVVPIHDLVLIRSLPINALD
jgi:hypothetical protein